MIGGGKPDWRWTDHLARTPRLAYAISILVPSVLVIAVLSTGVEPWIVLRDPIAAMGGDATHRHYGLLSNLGILAWAAAGSICLFVGLTDGARLSADARSFLLFAGVLTLILTLDDLFMVHENLDGPLVYAPYLIAVIFYLYRFGHVILSLDTALIAAALVFMGMSMAVDILIELRSQWSLPGQTDLGQENRGRSRPASLGVGFMEDVFKLLGICCWAVFHIRAASLLRSAPAGARSSPAR
jgi:hypothetical protein